MFETSKVFPNGLKTELGDAGMGFGQAIGGIAGGVGKVERSCSDQRYIELSNKGCWSI